MRVSGSSAARVCLNTQYAFVWPHDGHSASAVGRVPDISPMTAISFSVPLCLITCDFCEFISCVVPHLRQTSFPSCGNKRLLQLGQNIRLPSRPPTPIEGQPKRWTNKKVLVSRGTLQMESQDLGDAWRCSLCGLTATSASSCSTSSTTLPRLPLSLKTGYFECFHSRSIILSAFLIDFGSGET